MINNMTDFKYILWAWNGTLLNDVEDCIFCMNKMLSTRGLDTIDAGRYREIFTFPVIEYYRDLGFDFEKEPFTNLAEEYISLYTERSLASPLHKNVIAVLDQLKSLKYRQRIVSAMEQKALEEHTHLHGINHFFENIVGLDNIHAKSKIDNAVALIKNNSIIKDQCIVIGDTYHDFEVAEKLGARCILINNEHQQLKNYSFNDYVTIVDQISDILEII